MTSRADKSAATPTFRPATFCRDCRKFPYLGDRKNFKARKKFFCRGNSFFGPCNFDCPANCLFFSLRHTRIPRASVIPCSPATSFCRTAMPLFATRSRCRGPDRPPHSSGGAARWGVPSASRAGIRSQVYRPHTPGVPSHRRPCRRPKRQCPPHSRLPRPPGTPPAVCPFHELSYDDCRA